MWRILPSLEMGGVERTLISLLPRLQEEGIEVKVCCLYRRGVLAEEMEKVGIPVITLGMRARMDVDLKYLLGILRLAYLLKKERVDIVHTHLYRANTPGRMAAILAKVPVIIANEHNIDSWKTPSQMRMDRFLSQFTDKIIAVSNEVKEFYVNEVGIPENKLEVIYNGVDLKRFEKDFDKKKKKKELGLPLSLPLVGTIGRLQPQKDHKTFLKASSLILKKFPKVHFLIVGGGSLRRELEDFTKNLEIEKNVHFLGERKDIEEILPLMDIFVLTSKREGFPITVLEAMACGVPVVATSVGGTPEIIEDGKTGFLIPPENPHLLSEAIINLLKNEELGKEMGKYGKERVKLFSIEKMVKRTEFLYDKLLQTKLGIKN